MRYSYNTVNSLSRAQRSYARRYFQVRGEHLSPLVAVKLKPKDVAAVTTMNGLALLPAAETRVEAVADYPRAASRSNARVYTRGDYGAVVARGNRPWRFTVTPKDRVQMDLGVGPLVRVQQVLHVETQDPIASPRAGDVYLSTENGKATVTVGIYTDDNRVCCCRLAAFAVGDLAKVTICGARVGKLDPLAVVKMGRVRPGDVVLQFDEEVKLSMAKFGVGGEPLLEPNSEFAMPADAADMLYEKAIRLAAAGAQVPTALAKEVRVYECAFLTDFQEGLTSTDWRHGDVALAVAGQLDLFNSPVDVLADSDMEVVSVERTANGRHRLVCASGAVVEYPAGVSLAVVPGSYTQYQSLGVWERHGGGAIDVKSVLEVDLFRMLRDLAVSQAIVCENAEGRAMLFVPAGILGALAQVDESGEPLRWIAANAELWDDVLKSYVLPSIHHGNGAIYGDVKFDVLLPEIRKEKLAKRRMLASR